MGTFRGWVTAGLTWGVGHLFLGMGAASFYLGWTDFLTAAYIMIAGIPAALFTAFACIGVLLLKGYRL